MKKYFQSKRLELVMCYLIVFMAMCFTFQYHMGNYKEIADNASIYSTSVIGLFAFYIYLSIQNRKVLVEYLKMTGHDMYGDLKNESIFYRTIHRYFPIFLMATLAMPEINPLKLPYHIWFYFIMLIQTVLLFIA